MFLLPLGFLPPSASGTAEYPGSLFILLAPGNILGLDRYIDGPVSTSSEEMLYKLALVDGACRTTRRTPNEGQLLRLFRKAFETLMLFLLPGNLHPSPQNASGEVVLG